jgi:hypothetical protein
MNINITKYEIMDIILLLVITTQVAPGGIVVSVRTIGPKVQTRPRTLDLKGDKSIARLPSEQK